MKVLLTGAAGYIGSEVLLELVHAGHDVTALIRTPHTSELKSVRQVLHDLQQPIELQDDDFDLVIHSAGANEITSRDPTSALLLTTLTACNAAKFAARQRRPRLLYVSTVQVYGRSEGEINEDSPCFPLNNYALTHLFAEQWVEHYGRLHGLRWINARLGNIAGTPRIRTMDRWTLVPGCFCQSALENQRIVINSTGLQQRDFLSLAEAARRLTSLAALFDKYHGAPVNVCSGASLSIREVADMTASRYKLLSEKECSISFQSLLSTSSYAPQPLSIGSRLFDQADEVRMDQISAHKIMNACIDDTYSYLMRNI